jgi:hypothetical protein
MMFLVILRAIQMDAMQPWFKPPKNGVDSSGLRLRPNAFDSESQRMRREVTRGG